MKKILITGGTGYLGRNLANFYKKKYKVFLGARNNKQNFLVKNLTNCEVVPLDVSNIESVNDCLNYTKPDIVIHAAALKHVPSSEYNPFETIKTNVMGTQNVIESCIKNNVEKLITLSTDKASSPINLYGATKLLADKMTVAAENFKGKAKLISSVVSHPRP